MRIIRSLGNRIGLSILLFLACQKGGRLVDLRKGIEKELGQGDTVAAACSLLTALNNPVMSSSLVMGDVGADDLDSLSVVLVSFLSASGSASAAAGDLPDSWNKAYISLRITERYCDLKPAVAARMIPPALAVLSASSRLSLNRAQELASRGDTSVAIKTLDDAIARLSTPLPHLGASQALVPLFREKAGLCLAVGKLSEGMTVAEAVSVMGPPTGHDSVYAALSGDFYLMLSWDTVAALVRQDTVWEIVDSGAFK
ncbi:MAG: hypothetical protein ACP5QG_06265 [candidate division WOR-3 bacterium]